MLSTRNSYGDLAGWIWVGRGAVVRVADGRTVGRRVAVRVLVGRGMGVLVGVGGRGVNVGRGVEVSVGVAERLVTTSILRQPLFERTRIPNPSKSSIFFTFSLLCHSSNS